MLSSSSSGRHLSSQRQVKQKKVAKKYKEDGIVSRSDESDSSSDTPKNDKSLKMDKGMEEPIAVRINVEEAKSPIEEGKEGVEDKAILEEEKDKDIEEPSSQEGQCQEEEKEDGGSASGIPDEWIDYE